MKNINPARLAKMIFQFLDNQTDEIDDLNIALADQAKEHCMQGNIGKAAFLYLAISHINNASIERLKNEIADWKIEKDFSEDQDTKEELADAINVAQILLRAHKKSDEIALANYKEIESSIPIA
jgi:hypothetical protein